MSKRTGVRTRFIDCFQFIINNLECDRVPLAVVL